MKCKLICVGKLKESALHTLIKEYDKRLKRYVELEIIELKEGGGDERREVAIQKESEMILSKIALNSFVLLLDVRGKKFSSHEFAEILGEHKNFMSERTLTFVIGGSYGVLQELKERADILISFSDMTFSHQIFRVLFLEQLYRGYDILNNGKYHK